MAGELKSTLDIIMEKFGGKDQSAPLNEEQKKRIAEIRNIYQAKIAEVKILLKGDENLPREVSRLEREMEEKVQQIKSRSS